MTRKAHDKDDLYRRYSDEQKLELAIAEIIAPWRDDPFRLLSMVLESSPKNERAWLWLSLAAETVEEKREYLEMVLRINPDNFAAKRCLRLLELDQLRQSQRYRERRSVAGYRLDRGADLSNANLVGANLRGLDLSSVNFTLADLRNANLEEADLTGATFAGTNLTNAKLVKATLYKAKFDSLTPDDRERLDEITSEFFVIESAGGGVTVSARDSTQTLEDAFMELVERYGPDIRNEIVAHVPDLTNTDLRDANLICAEFYNADLTRAVFDGALLGSAKLERCMLTKSSLVDTDLRNCWLIDCILEMTDFRGAIVQAAQEDEFHDVANSYYERGYLNVPDRNGEGQAIAFSGVHLLRIQFDENTIWPNGFNAAAAEEATRREVDDIHGEELDEG